MSGSEESRDSSENSWRTRLEEKLREVDQQLRREMRARGFDPDQDDNLDIEESNREGEKHERTSE